MTEEFLNRSMDYEGYAIDNSWMVSERKARNTEQGVNKLPSEVLSRIFATGEDEERGERRWRASEEPHYVDFQVLASQVCSHWRDVAINDSTLWTYIHMTRPPYQMASLYLTRAGPTALLDIQIDLRERYWDSIGIALQDHTKQARHIPRLLGFLASHGAGVGRWKSLSICTAQYQVLVEFIHVLNIELAPALKSLSWRKDLNSTQIFLESIDESKYDSDEFRSLSGPSLPNLCRVEFLALPLCFLFRQPSLRLAGLTDLSLVSGDPLVSVPRLCEFLALNPQLESLDLSAGITRFQSQVELPAQSVCLPSLRSFKISTISQIPWAICILQSVDAPALSKLSLNCTSNYIPNVHPKSGQIAMYLATGQASYDNPHHGDRPNLTNRSCARYPSLRELDVSSLSCNKDELVAMLSSVPLLTHLCISGKQAECLGEAPWILPNLVSLTFSQLVYPHLGNVLRRRAEAGLPIRVIIAHKDFRQHVRDELPDTVEVKYYRDFYFKHEYRSAHETLEDASKGED